MIFVKRYGCDESVFGLSRIQSRVLHDYRYVRLDQARIVSVTRNWFRFFQIIKPDVLCPLRRDGYAIGPDRIAIRKEDRNLDMRVLAGCIEHANGFVAQHLWFGTVAPSGNVALGDRPSSSPDVGRIRMALPFN